MIQMALWPACGYVNFKKMELRNFDNGRLGLRRHLFALSANSEQWKKIQGFFSLQLPKRADRNLHMSPLTIFRFSLASIAKDVYNRCPL
jgi:hypothetical protein